MLPPLDTLEREPAVADRDDKSVSVARAGGANTGGTIWKDGAFDPDGWTSAIDGEALPDAPVVVSKTRWLVERATLTTRNAPLGLRLEPGETIDDIAGDLAGFALIALSFPKFNDGRAFSAATLLRTKHGYAGELRAVGNVLADQIPFMRRVGFDTLEVTHAPTRQALLEGRIAEVSLHYQPAAVAEPPAGTRPWLRRTSQ
jgi:phosphoadenosine phosphosulfate reductase